MDCREVSSKQNLDSWSQQYSNAENDLNVINEASMITRKG